MLADNITLKKSMIKEQFLVTVLCTNIHFTDALEHTQMMNGTPSIYNTSAQPFVRTIFYILL